MWGFCFLPHYCPTCVVFHPDQGLTDCVNGRNTACVCKLTVVLFPFMNSVNIWLTDWLVWAWYTAGRIHPVCVYAGDLSLFNSAGGWLGRLILDDWVHFWCSFELFWCLAVIRQASECVLVLLWVCACVLPPHLTPSQLATHMQAIVHSNIKHCAHLYAPRHV